MAHQVHGPLGALLVRLSLADSTDRRRPAQEGAQKDERALADQAADYLEWLLRNQAEAAGGMDNLPNVPRA